MLMVILVFSDCSYDFSFSVFSEETAMITHETMSNSLCTGKQGTRFLSWNQKELSPFLTSE